MPQDSGSLSYVILQELKNFVTEFKNKNCKFYSQAGVNFRENNNWFSNYILLFQVSLYLSLGYAFVLRLIDIFLWMWSAKD